VLSTRSSGEILVKRVAGSEETHLLVISEGRKDKDRSIRLSQEKRFLQDVEKLRSRVTQGRLKKTALINQAIGRLRERYPRVGRYYQLSYQEESRVLYCQEQAAERVRAESLDGSTLLGTTEKT